MTGAAALPLVPDGDEARDWAEHELSDPVYATAEPTAFDRFAREVADFFVRLFSGTLPQEWGPWVAVVLSVLAAALIAVAVLVWGLPRRRARSRTATDLFGAPEDRSAAQLRAAAAASVARGDWADAVLVRFRALARGLDERQIVDVLPGTTVHAFARDAAVPFPAQAADLEAAADAFEAVRYLRLPGTAELYGTVSRADDAVRAARPIDAQLQATR